MVDRGSFVFQVRDVTIACERTEGIRVGAARRNADIYCRAEGARSIVSNWNTAGSGSADGDTEWIQIGRSAGYVRRSTIRTAICLAGLVRILGERYRPQLIEVCLTV